jgi:hypothetical protein
MLFTHCIQSDIKCTILKKKNMGTRTLSEVEKKQSGNGLGIYFGRGLSGAELRTIKPRLDAPTSPKGVHVVHQEDAARLHPKPENVPISPGRRCTTSWIVWWVTRASRLHIDGMRRNRTFLFVMIRIGLFSMIHVVQKVADFCGSPRCRRLRRYRRRGRALLCLHGGQKGSKPRFTPS